MKMNISARISNEPLKTKRQLQTPRIKTELPGVLNFEWTLPAHGKKLFASDMAKTTLAFANRFTLVAPKVEITIKIATTVPPVAPITFPVASLATNGDVAISSIGRTYM